MFRKIIHYYVIYRKKCGLSFGKNLYRHGTLLKHNLNNFDILDKFIVKLKMGMCMLGEPPCVQLHTICYCPCVYVDVNIISYYIGTPQHPEDAIAYRDDDHNYDRL